MAAVGTAYDHMATSAGAKLEGYKTFLTNNIEADLESVPGIGPANAKSLVKSGILTTQNLLGEFLKLHRPRQTVKAHLNAFAAFLEARDIHASRNLVCRAIAEKLSTFIPDSFVHEDFE